MDIKTLLNNLHEEVSCSVCMTTFTDPKQLPCLHSFCLHCLNGILRTSGRRDIIACPECRRDCKVPARGNLSDLPTNFRINSLLDVLAIKECNTTGVKCGNCDKKNSQSFYCFQCCAFWCDNCITAHNIIRTNKEHRVLALKDFQDQDIEDVLKRPAFCPKPGHEKKELEFFCKNCAEPICNSCVATIHDGHVKVLLEEAANERKLEFQSVVESQKEKAQQMRKKITKLDETCTRIQTQVANAKGSVQQFADDMMAVIEAKKEEMLNEVENRGQQSLTRLQKQRSEIENGVKMFETEVEKTETLLRRSTSAEIAQMKMNNINPQEEVGREKEQVDCDLEGLRQFTFVKNETVRDKIKTEGIGSFKTFLSKTEGHKSSAEGKGITEAIIGLEAQLILTTRNAEGEQCYEERDCVTVEIRNQQGHGCATKVQVQDSKGGSYKISYFAKETGKCKLSVKVNGINITGSPFAVQVKARQFKPVLSFGKRGFSAGMLYLPWGVAVNGRNEIAVTEHGNNRVSLFSSDGTYLRSFGREGDKDGEFRSPSGIAFDKNDNIIVADSSNHRVQLFSEQGEYLNQFGEQGSLDHQLKSPYGLSVDSDGNIIVADSGNKVIKIFSPTGQCLLKIHGEGSIAYPWHCVQYDNYLIVSDSSEHCIRVFDRDGNFLYKFGKRGRGVGQLKEPRCMSVNKAGQLVVHEPVNERAQVFELSGKFVTTFGKIGRGVSTPFSSAVLSDGRIVVADREFSQIKIFE